LPLSLLAVAAVVVGVGIEVDDAGSGSDARTDGEAPEDRL